RPVMELIDTTGAWRVSTGLDTNGGRAQRGMARRERESGATSMECSIWPGASMAACASAWRACARAQGCPEPGRPSARRHRFLTRIIVEATSGLAAIPAGLDIFDEQRGGAELGVTGGLVEDAANLQAGIQPDEICQR